MFAVARGRGIGTPICVTTGNEADVTIGDVIGWLAEDPETDVIAAYAEGIREPEGFLAALEAARRAKKPVVMMKVGTSAIGANAARSHTASIAGDDRVTDAVLAEFGAVRARTTEEMLDIALTATRRIYPAGNTLGVITISGGAGVLISDAAEAVGLPLPEMPAAAQARLKALLPFAAPRNPVDCTAQAFNDISLIGRFTDSMVEEGGYSSILAFFTQVGGSRDDRAAAARAAQRHQGAASGPALRALGGRPAGAGAGLRGGWVRRVRGPDPGGGGDPRDGPVRRCFRGRRVAGRRRRCRRSACPRATPSEAEAKRILAAGRHRFRAGGGLPHRGGGGAGGGAGSATRW